MAGKTLLERWESCRADTRKVAAAIPEGREDFSPAPGAMSLGAHILHVISAERTALNALTATPGKWEWDTGIDLKHYPKIKDILGILDEESVGFRKYLAGLKPADLDKVAGMPWAPKETVGDLWLDWIIHETHHRANVITSMRVAGITPPNIWG